MNRPLRVVFVNSHPIQYFAPLYSFLNREPSLDVTVLYCSDFSLRGAVDPGFKHPVAWNVDLLDGYRSVFLGAAARRRTPRGFWSLVCTQVWAEIRNGKYDAVVVHGYSYAVNILAILAARSRGVPVLMRSETHLGLKRSRWKRWMRDTFLSTAYRFIDGFLAIGTANRLYYLSLGVPAERVFDVPYTVDNARFMGASNLSVEERAETRRKYGIPTNIPVVLFASKLMRRKHPETLLQAMLSLRDRGPEAFLLIVGTGEMEHELREAVRSNNMTNVVFAGFINQAELPRLYAASDVFVLPSEDEPWGLVVNEVMCAGLPVIVSDEVGCVPDLVRVSINGYHMKAGNVESLAQVLKEILSDGAKRKEMGSASLSLISDWDYGRCSKGIRAAIRSLSRNAQSSP